LPPPLLVCLRSWIEETGCQACGLPRAGCQARRLKRQVVRPMRNSLQVRECVEEVNSPGGNPVTATELCEFLSGLLLNPRKGGGAVDELCDSEGVYSWGGTRMWGMRVCEQWA
jgi:hypothetical protein